MGYRNHVVKVLIVVDSLEVGTPGQLLPTLVKAVSSEVQLEVVSLHPLSEKSSMTVQRLEELGVAPHFLGVRKISELRSVKRVADAIRTSRCGRTMPTRPRGRSKSAGCRAATSCRGRPASARSS